MPQYSDNVMQTSLHDLKWNQSYISAFLGFKKIQYLCIPHKKTSLRESLGSNYMHDSRCDSLQDPFFYAGCKTNLIILVMRHGIRRARYVPMYCTAKRTWQI